MRLAMEQRKQANGGRGPLLILKGVGKSFGALRALDDVNFSIYPGEVQALVGDNGAGKSTLVKIIAGAHKPDQGELLFNGKPIELSSPSSALALGIATVYQDLRAGWHTGRCE